MTGTHAPAAATGPAFFAGPAFALAAPVQARAEPAAEQTPEEETEQREEPVQRMLQSGTGDDDEQPDVQAKEEAPAPEEEPDEPVQQQAEEEPEAPVQRAEDDEGEIPDEAPVQRAEEDEPDDAPEEPAVQRAEAPDEEPPVQQAADEDRPEQEAPTQSQEGGSPAPSAPPTSPAAPASPGPGVSAHAVAARGLQGAARPLPWAEQIQRAFGRHDVSDVRTQVGGPADYAGRQLHALAYTRGNRIAFREAPGLHLAAHEAAHVVQQRRGVHLKGGLSRVGDPYERQADQAADAVVAGRSAEAILDAAPPVAPVRARTPVQRACSCGGTCPKCRGEEAGPDKEAPDKEAPTLADTAVQMASASHPDAAPAASLRATPVRSSTSRPLPAPPSARSSATRDDEAPASVPDAGGDGHAFLLQAKCDCGGTCAECAGREPEDDEAVQMALEVNARRLEEPPLAGEDEGGAAPEGGGGETPGGEAEGEPGGEGGDEAGASGAESEAEAEPSDVESREESAASEEAASREATSPEATSEDPGASGGQSSQPPESSSAEGGGGGGGGPAAEAPAGPDASSGAETTDTGGDAAETSDGAGGGGAASEGPACEPSCYDAPSDQPAREPDATPPNPPPGEVKEETSAGDEEDAPEPDDCTADAGVSGQGGAPAGGGSGQGGAAPGAAPAADGGAPTSDAAASPEGAAAGDGGAAAPEAAAPEAAAPEAAAPGGGGGGAPGGGGGEGSGTDEAAASQLDPGIAQAEAGRDEAVAAYQASSQAMAEAPAGIRALRTATRFAERPGEGSAAAAQRRAAARRADTFFSGVADRLDAAIEMATRQVPDQLGIAAESAKAELTASIDAQKQAISARIEQARTQARADAAMAREEVMRQAESFVTDAETQTTAAITSLTTVHTTTTAQVDGLETTTLEGINRLYERGKATLEGIGTRIGGECTTVGETYAGRYEGFKSCTEDGFWDGNLAERRALAQAKAARKTAEGYRERMVEAARKRAREVTRAGRKSDRCAVITSAIQARDTLDGQLKSLKAALEAARDGAIEQAGATRDTLLASIDASLASTLRQLDRQEHDQRQAVNDAGYMQQVLQEQIAHASAAAVQRGVETAVTAARSALTALQAQFTASLPPDVASLERALSQVERNIGSALDELETSATGGATAAEGRLFGAAQQGLGALEAITQSNDEATTAISDGFLLGMSQIAGTDNFATQRAGFTRQVQKSSTDGGAALRKAGDGMRQSCAKVVGAATTALAKAGRDLEKNLGESRKGLECDITAKADEAASQEPPAWKQIVAVLLVILVIVIVIAVTILTAGMALGPIATIAVGIAIGAAVGAVTSGLLAVAGNLWSNRSWSQGVGHAILVGAITGAIGGGIGAGVGLVFKGASVAVQLGAALVTSAALDVATQYVLGGFSFDKFSWGNFALTLVITVLTFGIAHRAAGARARAGGGGAGDEGAPAPRPGDEGGAAPRPADDGAPAPRPADDGAPAPRPADDGAPAPRPGDEGAPAPRPGDDGAPAPRPGDDGAPSSRPTEEAPAPPSTPDETAPTRPAPDETAPPKPAPDETAPPKPAPDETAPPKTTPDETAPPKTSPDEPAPPASPDEMPEPVPQNGPDEVPPWQQGRNPQRYRRYVNNLRRRNPDRKPLGPEEWWNQHGSKKPANPHGGEGNPAHQAKVSELVGHATSQYPPPRYVVTSNKPVPGVRQKPDAAVIDTHTGEVVKIYEAARFNKSGRLIRPDERAKIVDYEAAGIPYEFHPVGPNAPPGGVLRSPSPTPEPPPSTPPASE